MANLTFEQAGIAGLVTVVGGQVVPFESEQDALGLTAEDVSKLKTSIGLSTRRVVSNPKTTTSDLCVQAANHLFRGTNTDPASIDALIFVSQTPDYSAPSTAISMQHRLGMRIETMCFDMRLGCSGFVYGLAVAYSLVQSGFSRVLLCVGDVASRMVPHDDRTITPIMGDAGSAALIERRETKSFFQLYSDGSGEKALYIPNSGLREDARPDAPALMRMDGAQVFAFTLKRVPSLLNDIMNFSGVTVDDVDFFVLHQPNKYILSNVQRRLKLDESKLPTRTQSQFGNQNSASIPGTISGFLSESYSSKSLYSIFAGFGIGLSWGACAVKTEAMFAPSAIPEQEPA